MEEDDRQPKTRPGANELPPGPPPRTTVGLGGDGDEFNGKSATITTVAEGEGKFIRPPDKIVQYGHVIVRIEPNGRGKGVMIRNEITDSAIPKRFIESAIEGIRAGLDARDFGGPEVTDVVVQILGGSTDPNTSSGMAYKMAAIFAIKDALKKAGLKAID